MVSTGPDEYLTFPTKFPIFPYYVYMTKINRYLYNYIARNNIKYVVAFALKPGVAKKQFRPMSAYHLEKECKLLTYEVSLKATQNKGPK